MIQFVFFIILIIFIFFALMVCILIHFENLSKNIFYFIKNLLEKINSNITGLYTNMEDFNSVEDCVSTYEYYIKSGYIESINKNILYDERFLKKAIEINPYILRNINCENINLNIYIKYCVIKYVCLNEVLEKYKNVKEIIVITINRDCKYYYLIPKDLQYDNDVILSALSCRKFKEKITIDGKKIDITYTDRKKPYGYLFLPNEFREDIIISKIALGYNGNLIKFLPNNLKNNKELIKIAIDENVECCKLLDDSFKNDKEIAIYAISKKLNNINYFSPFIKKDNEILQKVTKMNWEIIKIVDVPYNGFEFFWKNLLYKDGYLIRYMDHTWSKGRTYISNEDIESHFLEFDNLLY